MKTLIRITLVASAVLSFSASVFTPFNYQVVELSRTPYFDKPIHVAIRTREEWLAFTKLPGDWPQRPPAVPGQVLRPPRNRPSPSNVSLASKYETRTLMPVSFSKDEMVSGTRYRD